MCTFSAPLSPTASEVWVIASCETDGSTYAVRLAFSDEHNTYGLLPADDFDVRGVLPLWPETGEPITGLRWADVADLELHPPYADH